VMWAALRASTAGPAPSARAAKVAELIAADGASFFAEIVDGTGLLRTEVEEALGELVALGMVNCDSFGGLRALLVPSDRRKPWQGRGLAGTRRRRRTALFGIEDAGRWALVKRKLSPPFQGGVSGEARRGGSAVADQEIVEHVARTLLKRYGVVFWRLLAREAEWLPPWRELLRIYRRLEARGEIRGGRFVAGITGEQYAAPEAVGMLRETRRAEAAGSLVSLSGADPLNLVGILTPGTRLPALTGNRVLYRDGLPIALLAAGEVRFLEKLAPEAEWGARNALLRRQVPAMLQFLG